MVLGRRRAVNEAAVVALWLVVPAGAATVSVGHPTVRLAALFVHLVIQQLRAIPKGVAGDAIPWQFARRAIVVAGISQMAWWGAMAIGFLRTASRLD
jgi:hypothetical protein